MNAQNGSTDIRARILALAEELSRRLRDLPGTSPEFHLRLVETLIASERMNEALLAAKDSLRRFPDSVSLQRRVSALTNDVVRSD